REQRANPLPVAVFGQPQENGSKREGGDEPAVDGEEVSFFALEVDEKRLQRGLRQIAMRRAEREMGERAIAAFSNAEVCPLAGKRELVEQRTQRAFCVGGGGAADDQAHRGAD